MSSNIQTDEKRFELLYKNAETLYRFVTLYSQYTRELRDYGVGEPINMVDVHTLTMIYDLPGITNQELAKMWGHTKGAVSQTLRKLEEKNLIYREKSTDDGRQQHLYVTEEGKALSIAHKEYDYKMLTLTETALLEKFSLKEIENFYNILEYYIELLEE